MNHQKITILDEDSDLQDFLQNKPFFLLFVGNIFLHWNHFNSLESEATRPPSGLELAAAEAAPVSPPDPEPAPEPEPAKAILLRNIEFLRPLPPTRPTRPIRPIPPPPPPP